MDQRLKRPRLLIKVKRGPAETVRERQPLKYGEWVWLNDTHQLATGDGVSKKPLVYHYRGGLLTFMFEVAWIKDIKLWLPMLPLSVPADILATIVLEEGEIVYCPENNWLYVGDGETKGGIRAQ